MQIVTFKSNGRNISNSSVPGTAGVNYCLVFFFIGENFLNPDLLNIN